MRRPLRSEIRVALIAADMRWVCHLTYADQLPDIFASGGLLSPARRGSHPAHSWGANRDAGMHLICLAPKTNWGMVKRMNGREVALLIVDLKTLTDHLKLRVTPTNSGSRDATPFLASDADMLGTLSRVAADRRAHPDAEVLVQDGIPLSSVRGLVFGDTSTRDSWLEPAFASLSEPADWINVRIASAGRRFLLPPDYVATDRRLPHRPGRDQLARRFSSRPWPEREDPHWMDLDDWDRAEETDQFPSWADFYDLDTPE